MIISPGATSQTITVQIVDDSGLAVTGLVGATFPTTSYERSAEALVGITLSDLAALTSAYSSGGVKEVGGGYYRLDVPDAAFATASKVRIIGEASGKHILYPVITCAYIGANAVQVNGTVQTARDIGASVLLSSGAGAGQLDFTSGVVKSNVSQLLGGTVPAPNVTGVPLVDLKYTLGTISPATAGSVRTDSVTGAVGSVTGAVGSVTGNVGGNVVGSVASVTARVTANADQFAGQTITAAAGVTLPSSVASPTNITAGTITTATNLTNNNDKTGYGLSAAAVQTIWDALTSALTAVGSIGKLLVTNIDALVSSRTKPADTQARVTLVDTVTTYTGNTPQTGDNFARLGAPAGASIAADIAEANADADELITTIGAAGAGLSAIPTVAHVTLVDTVTTLTGHTAQTGDSFPFADRTVGRGTVGATSPTTTTFTPSALTPAGVAADQFKGRIIIFDRTTTTAALRGQSTDITGSSAAALPLLTFTALTTAPASTDTFSIV